MIFAGSDLRAVTLAGEAWLLGCGAVFFVLFVLSMVGIPWSLLALLIGMAILVLGFSVPRVLGSSGRSSPDTRGPEHPRTLMWPRLAWPNLIDLLTLAMIAGYVRIATIAQPVETDYLTIWGVVGKEFWLHRGIHWDFLATTQNPNTHVDYPILVPLLYVAEALLGGAWPERLIGAITAAFGIAALLVVRGLLADDMPKLGRAIATAVLVPLVFSPFIGLAEGPLVAYALAGLLFIRRGMRTRAGGEAGTYIEPHPPRSLAPLGMTEARASITRGAVYLGLAASCKAEGLAIVLAVIVAMAVSRAWALLPRLWPAFAIPLPWILLVKLHGLASTHLQSGMFERLASRLADPGPLIRAFLDYPPGRPLFWIGVALACAIGWRRVATQERLFAIVGILQPLFFLGVYLVSAYDLDWLVHWSWDRIIRQAMPVVALLALFCIMPFVIALTHASEPRTDR